MTKSILPLLILSALVSSCRAPDRDRTAAGAPNRPDSGSALGERVDSSAKPVCARTGKWALCSVEKRLEQSGFVVRPDSGPRPRRPGFRVSPVVYTLGRSRLEVFVYPTAETAAQDVEELDTLAVAPRGSRGPWTMTPTFVRNANLIAVFLTDSPVQAERLSLALQAGAPQP
jgi:hypothetical protein